jgi:toxin FitB
MLILDTNAISELMRSEPDPVFLQWFDAQDARRFTTTSINWAELKAGVQRLPDGKRKTGLAMVLQEIHTRVLRNGILAFYESVAECWASLIAELEARGQPIGFAYSQIAAIALLHGHSVVTRDVKPFIAAGVSVVNPWQAI